MIGLRFNELNSVSVSEVEGVVTNPSGKTIYFVLYTNNGQYYLRSFVEFDPYARVILMNNLEDGSRFLTESSSAITMRERFLRMAAVFNCPLFIMRGINHLTESAEAFMLGQDLTCPKALFLEKEYSKDKFKEEDLYNEGTIVVVINNNRIVSKACKIISIVDKKKGIYRIVKIDGTEENQLHDKLIPNKESFDFILTRVPYYEAKTDCGELFKKGDKFLCKNGYLYNKEATIAIALKPHTEFFNEINK